MCVIDQGVGATGQEPAEPPNGSANPRKGRRSGLRVAGAAQGGEGAAELPEGEPPKGRRSRPKVGGATKSSAEPPKG